MFILGFLREMGMPTTSQVCFVPRFSPLPSLSLRRETRQGKKETLGTSLMVFSVSLRCFSTLLRNSQLSNMHLFKLLFASYMVKQTVITIFVKSLLK